MSRHFVTGEEYVADPRERRLRVIAQLIDKPLTVIGVALAFALAARGPGLIVPGYTPSGWFTFGLWVTFSVALRLVIVSFLAWFRTRYAIPAPVTQPVEGFDTKE
jgi:hypothetical protein